MVIELYNCSSDKKRVSKNITLVNSYDTCRLKEDTNIVDPTFIITKTYRNNLPVQELEITSFNYVYIPYLKRYYFCKYPRLVKGGMIELDCHVDVLMTYNNYIYNHKAYVIRCEKKFFSNKSKNGIFYDSDFPIRSDVTVETKDIGNVANSFAYFLTVNGGVV